MRIRNVPSYLAASGIEIDVPDFGPLTLDVAYGGNFYAIVEPQGAYTGLDDLGAARIVAARSQIARRWCARSIEPVHPLDATIRGVSHVLWADKPQGDGADGRNAVFYGDKAIDRSPVRHRHLGAPRASRTPRASSRSASASCTRATSAAASSAASRRRPTSAASAAIIPSIEGSAIATGFNTIWIDREDTFWHGFQVV